MWPFYMVTKLICTPLFERYMAKLTINNGLKKFKIKKHNKILNFKNVSQWTRLYAQIIDTNPCSTFYTIGRSGLWVHLKRMRMFNLQLHVSSFTLPSP